ncbi:hypothetical protein GLYMA_06G007000v4 [Glycine max]|uniref:Uncharacterized protein n=1 Tax=Glycine max TaxID=3847 RepID=A0A0R0J9V4_SOYBN|nr:hypothetical protein JHK85_014388 [Glycine max]KRH51447.1 hypothetical protein GLYMA_06G007000v4 [Glycine max]
MFCCLVGLSLGSCYIYLPLLITYLLLYLFSQKCPFLRFTHLTELTAREDKEASNEIHNKRKMGEATREDTYTS